MEIFIIKNWSTREELEIVAINWEIDKYQHMFYCVNDIGNSIISKSFSTRYWDLLDRYSSKKD